MLCDRPGTKRSAELLPPSASPPRGTESPCREELAVPAPPAAITTEMSVDISGALTRPRITDTVHVVRDSCSLVTVKTRLQCKPLRKLGSSGHTGEPEICRKASCRSMPAEVVPEARQQHAKGKGACVQCQGAGGAGGGGTEVFPRTAHAAWEKFWTTLPTSAAQQA